MSFYNTMQVGADPDSVIKFGCGFLDEVAEQIMSPERAAIVREAAEKEQRDFEEAEEAKRQEAEDTANFWARMHGEPAKRGPAEVLKDYDAATARADRREAAKAAQQHIAECGCDECGSRHFVGAIDTRPHRLPSLVAKQKAAEAAKFLAMPAIVGDVEKLAADVDKVKGTLGGEVADLGFLLRRLLRK